MPSANPKQLPVEAEEQGLRHLDALTQERMRDLQAARLPMQSLRRTGQRPFAFNGVVIATVCGVGPSLPFWYELNLHRTVLGTCVSDIRLFNKGMGRADLFRVAEHDDVDSASDYFERYDASADLALPTGMLAAGLTAARLTLETAKLQMQVNEIVDHYRAQVGELLGKVQALVE